MSQNNGHISGTAITDDELKTSILGIMDSIDAFCRKNDIRYYLLGGSLLGAVRHRGFIPWDDDIDIGLPRPDYEKFCRLYNDGEKGYQVKYIGNDPSYYLPFAKVVDTATSLYEAVYRAPELGTYVDVFPLDYVSKDAKGSCRYFDNTVVRNLQDLKYMKVKKGRKLWQNMLIVLSRFFCPFSLHSIACMREKRAMRFSREQNTGWLANLHGAWEKKEIVKSDFFGNGQEYEFENRRFMGPEDYDGYLTTLYGDYMTPPPPEKRITHHGFTASWK